MHLFWTFVLLFYLTINVLALLYILFCLICQNLLILKNGLIKKNLNCDAVNKFLYFQTDVLPKFRKGIYFNPSFGRIIGQRQEGEREKDINLLLEQLLFLKQRKQDDKRNISPVLIVHLQKCQRMLKCVRRNGQQFFILLIQFGLKSRF